MEIIVIIAVFWVVGKSSRGYSAASARVTTGGTSNRPVSKNGLADRGNPQGIECFPQGFGSDQCLSGFLFRSDANFRHVNHGR